MIYIKSFAQTDHEIDRECLADLTEETIKEIIPKIGPRTKFLKQLKTYQALNNSEIVYEAELQPIISNVRKLMFAK